MPKAPRRIVFVAVLISLLDGGIAFSEAPHRQGSTAKPRNAAAFEWMRNVFMQTWLSDKVKGETPDKSWGFYETPTGYKELRDCVVSMETESRFSGAIKRGHISATEVDYSTLNPDVVVSERKVATKDSPEKIVGYSVTAYTYQLRRVVRVRV